MNVNIFLIDKSIESIKILLIFFILEFKIDDSLIFKILNKEHHLTNNLKEIKDDKLKKEILAHNSK